MAEVARGASEVGRQRPPVGPNQPVQPGTPNRAEHPGGPGVDRQRPATPTWPEEPPAPGADRPDWRDTLRNAADLALLGIAATVATLPVVTAGAALGTASAALHHWIETGSWPGLRATLRGFGRRVLPGAGATAVAGLAGTLLAVNLLVLGRGVVPGGTVLVAVTVALAVAAGGFAGLTIVQLGRQGGEGWGTAARAAARLIAARPAVLLGTAGVVALAGLLCVLVLPLLTPILLGYTLLGLHATTRRIAGSDLS
ncbi:hypothetical protein [Micromonospora sp. HM5-17]|uniref:hypothetical protein n=1 Tax=Micromonospora sp. HM5-17 TaxID=2487710 RepID=UPI001F345761|nr:hypothetical protein [Micromonospora sp. HM5-17]